MDEASKLTEEDKLAVVDKLAEKIKQVEEVKLTEKIKQVEEAKLIKKAKLINETRIDKARRYILGPFQFLALSLIVSESLLAYWMSNLFDFTSSTDYYERIVVGSLSIAILIAVLVVFSVVYKIKKHHGDCEH
jgi:hypothetical protein